MSKLIVAYSIAAVCLFAALFSAFFLAGLGAPATAWNQPDPLVEVEQAEIEAPNPLLAELDYPSLELNRTYRVSHDTRLYPNPEAITASAEVLPARGYFIATDRIESGTALWYRVNVNNGVRDYEMFLLAKDLNLKRVTPIYSQEEQKDQRIEDAIEVLRQYGEERRARRIAAAPPPEPEVPSGPETFGEWWAMTSERMGGAQAATFAVSGVAAAIGTALTIGSFLLIHQLRRDHTWERPVHSFTEEESDAMDDDVFGERDPESPDTRW